MTQRLTDGSGVSLLRTAVMLAMTVMLLGCESLGMSAPSIPGLSGLFETQQTPLPGNRVSVFKSEGGQETSSIEVNDPVNLPPAQNNPSWSQPGGVASNAPGHLALAGGLQTSWRASAGEGSSSRGRLTAIPIVFEGRVFTLDIEGTVTAFSANGGGSLWRVSLKPSHERARSGYGGGLAADSGRLYVATGYGTLAALDPASGKQLWSKFLSAPFRNSPTAVDGKVFAVNTESQLFCLSGDDGKELWNSRGLPETAVMLSNVSPAALGNLLVVPYPSGELAAFDIKTGQPRWTESLTKAAVGSAIKTIGDSARPVIDGNMVFAVSQAGRMIATAKDSGERLWSRDISASQTPWVAGDSVFVVDLSGKLMALTRKDGKVRWVTNLPEAKSWTGPVLAGGKLWLASANGLLVGVDAQSGAVASQVNLENPVYITPVVAGGRIYVLTDKARLISMN